MKVIIVYYNVEKTVRYIEPINNVSVTTTTKNKPGSHLIDLYVFPLK